MIKSLVISILAAILIIGCGTPEDLGISKVNVTENPAAEAPLPPLTSSGDKCGNAYYPIVDSATWTYQITVQEDAPITATYSWTVVDDGSFTLTVQGNDDLFTMASS